jgi:hypothetical protein
MTLIWLPLIYNASGGGSPYAGAALVEATCNAGDATQRWTMPTGSGSVVHAASGLCVASSGGSLVLGACDGSAGTSWVQTPNGGGKNVSITNGAAGSGCLDWNAIDDLPHAPGNPIIAYACGTAWNELWLAPQPGATGPIQASLSYGGGPSNLCVTAVAGQNQDWTLPWNPAWSLKDY